MYIIAVRAVPSGGSRIEEKGFRAVPWNNAHAHKRLGAGGPTHAKEL